MGDFQKVSFSDKFWQNETFLGTLHLFKKRWTQKFDNENTIFYICNMFYVWRYMRN